MNKKILIQSAELESALAEWALGIASRVYTSPREDFLVKARRLARKAEAFRQMRREAKRTGFKPLPLPDYLAELAKTARLNLAAVLPTTTQKDSPASSWIDLARQIEVPSDVIRLLARLWVAVNQSAWERSPVMARKLAPGSVRRVEPRSYASYDASLLEARLEVVEREYPPEAKRLLKETLAGI